MQDTDIFVEQSFKDFLKETTKSPDVASRLCIASAIQSLAHAVMEATSCVRVQMTDDINVTVNKD